MDATVDLIGDDPHLAVARPVRDRFDLGLRIHGARGIAGRAEDQPPRSGDHAIEIPYGHLEAPLGLPGDEHRPGAGQVHDLRIRHPRRRRNRHHIARAEQREARVEQRLLRAVRHHDIVGVQWAAAREQRQMLRRGGAQLQDPFVRRVVGLALANGADPGVGRERRRREIRLPRAQIDHILAGRLAPFRLLRDGDRRGRFEVVQVG